MQLLGSVPVQVLLLAAFALISTEAQVVFPCHLACASEDDPMTCFVGCLNGVYSWENGGKAKKADYKRDKAWVVPTGNYYRTHHQERFF